MDSNKLVEENQLDKGDEVLMVANGDLCFKKMTKENVDKIRNQLANHTQTSSVATEQERLASS